MKTKIKCVTLMLWPLLVVAATPMAQDAGSLDPATISNIYPGKAYSPYAQRSFPS